MKKAITVIISALYVIAIIIIAFFGSETMNREKTVHVENIILTNETYAIGGKTIYEVNPNVNWENNKNQVKYTIVIRDYNYFYATMGNAIQLKAKVEPDNADITAVEYTIVDGEKYSTITEIGEHDAAFSFTSKLETARSAIVKIKANDGSGTEIKIGIVAVVTA